MLGLFYKCADVDNHDADKIESLRHLDVHNVGKPLKRRTTLGSKAKAGCERRTRKNLSISIFHPGEKPTNHERAALVNLKPYFVGNKTAFGEPCFANKIFRRAMALIIDGSGDSSGTTTISTALSV